MPRTLGTTGLPEVVGLVEGTQRLAAACEGGSVFVVEAAASPGGRGAICASGWASPRRWCRLGRSATCAHPDVRAEERRDRRPAGRYPPHGHAAQTRMAARQCVLRPESRTPITRVTQRTPLALGAHDLLPPARLVALSLEEVSQLLRQAGSGHSGRAAAVQARQRALTPLALPPADAAVSSSRALAGRSSLDLVDPTSGPLERRIRELLARVAVRHHRDEILFCGPLAIGTVLGELGHPAGCAPPVRSLPGVAWTPPCPPRSGDRPQACSHARQSVWPTHPEGLEARNGCKYTAIGRRFWRLCRVGNSLGYAATVCAFAARLAWLSWARLRDGTPYDARRAVQAYLPGQSSTRGAFGPVEDAGEDGTGREATT